MPQKLCKYVTKKVCNRDTKNLRNMTNYATARGWETIMSYLNFKNDLFMSTQHRVMSREGPLSYPELTLPKLLHPFLVHPSPQPGGPILPTMNFNP